MVRKGAPTNPWNSQSLGQWFRRLGLYGSYSNVLFFLKQLIHSWASNSKTEHIVIIRRKAYTKIVQFMVPGSRFMFQDGTVWLIHMQIKIDYFKILFLSPGHRTVMQSEHFVKLGNEPLLFISDEPGTLMLWQGFKVSYSEYALFQNHSDVMDTKQLC